MAKVNPTPSDFTAEDKLPVAPLNQLLPSLKLEGINTTSGTALASRTTKDVIADLKRPLQVPKLNSSKLRKKCTSDFIGLDSNLAQNKKQYVEQWVTDVVSAGTDNEDDENAEYDEESEDEDEIRQTSKPRKITERRRRTYAIADSYIQKALQKSLDEGISAVKPGEEEMQSARWLVNQSESHQIITTPREYQTELFERAKEKNIIAVLETGEILPSNHN
jgi:endoribonuclease Dicer